MNPLLQVIPAPCQHLVRPCVLLSAETHCCTFPSAMSLRYATSIPQCFSSMVPSGISNSLLKCELALLGLQVHLELEYTKEVRRLPRQRGSLLRRYHGSSLLARRCEAFTSMEAPTTVVLYSWQSEALSLTTAGISPRGLFPGEAV